MGSAATTQASPQEALTRAPRKRNGVSKSGEARELGTAPGSVHPSRYLLIYSYSIKSVDSSRVYTRRFVNSPHTEGKERPETEPALQMVGGRLNHQRHLRMKLVWGHRTSRSPRRRPAVRVHAGFLQGSVPYAVQNGPVSTTPRSLETESLRTAPAVGTVGGRTLKGQGRSEGPLIAQLQLIGGVLTMTSNNAMCLAQFVCWEYSSK